jgi:hypothetical protein
MDTRTADRQVIERVLSEYASIPYAHGDVETQTVFDTERGHYLLMIVGREKQRRRSSGSPHHPRHPRATRSFMNRAIPSASSFSPSAPVQPAGPRIR